MIELKNVIKTFDRFNALDGLDMHVPSGSIYGLVGPNGSGKTTSIKHITGVYRQDSGEVLVDGEPVFENTAIKSRIAFIPDDIWYLPQADITDMKNFYRGIFPRFDCDRFDKLRDAFALNEKLPIRRMSKGMQKQASFWLAMSMRPDILVLDEPVDGLDPVMRRQVWSIIIGDAAENGTTVLISSHNLRELEDVCDHVGVIKNGKMMLERSLAEMQDNIMKVQYVFADNQALGAELDVLHESVSGRLRTAIIRGSADEITEKIGAYSPLFFDVVPLTLEEIFIYELGGADYAVKDIVLS